MSDTLRFFLKPILLVLTFTLFMPTNVMAVEVKGDSPLLLKEVEEIPDIAQGAEVNERIRERINLLDSFHEASSRLQVTSLESFNGSESGSVNLFNSIVSVALLPRLHVGGDLPIFVGGGAAGSAVVIGNPQVNARGMVYSNLSREFPHFIYLNGWLQFPRKGSSMIVVDRTDIGISSEIKKMFYRFILNSDIGFVSRMDSKNSTRRYGDEIYIGIGGEYYFAKLPVAVETSLLWRNAWSATIDGNITPRQSIMTSSSNIKYEPWVGVWFESGIDIPLKSGNLGEIATLFGDYDASGLWGTTFWVSAKYQF